MNAHWSSIEQMAGKTIEETILALPGPLAERARALPITLTARPNRRQQEDGIDPDTLGLFLGSDYASEPNALDPIPPHIILFLDNIWDEAEGQVERFKTEIRTTLLHELGHYLGLDEDELTERGLD